MKTSFFQTEGKWLKGNVHSHTTRTDGTCMPEQQISDYAAKGYDFLAITDHNVVASHQLTGENDICMIPGWERDIRHTEDNTSCIHVVGLFSTEAQETPELEKRRYDVNEISDQQLIDEMKSDGEFVIVAHPRWSRMTPQDVLALQHYDAIEVFNTGCETLMHSGHAELYWDLLLENGRSVLGIASDDTHGLTQKSDRFGGWIMVNTPEKTASSIIRSMRSGNYYFTQGPEIIDWGMESGKIYVSCSPCREIHFITYKKRGKSFFAMDELLTNAVYTLKGEELYVRIECIDEEGKVAWSNPFFF